MENFTINHDTAQSHRHILTAERVADVFNGAQLALRELCHLGPTSLECLVLATIAGTCHYLLGMPNVGGNPHYDKGMESYDRLRTAGEELRKWADAERAADGATRAKTSENG